MNYRHIFFDLDHTLWDFDRNSRETLEELFEIATALQLGQHKKPIGLLNINGFYDELLASLQKMVVLGFVKQHNLDLVLVDTTVEGLLCKMDGFKAPDKAVW